MTSIELTGLELDTLIGHLGMWIDSDEPDVRSREVLEAIYNKLVSNE
jgi:hypothetical protein